MKDAWLSLAKFIRFEGAKLVVRGLEVEGEGEGEGDALVAGLSQVAVVVPAVSPPPPAPSSSSPRWAANGPLALRARMDAVSSGQKQSADLAM